MPRRITSLNVNDSEVYRLAKSLARRTGESMTEVVRQALRERRAREEQRQGSNLLMQKLTAAPLAG